MSRPNARRISPEFYQLQTAEKVLNRAITANLEILHPEVLDVALDLYEDAIRELRNLNDKSTGRRKKTPRLRSLYHQPEPFGSYSMITLLNIILAVAFIAIIIDALKNGGK